MIGWALVMSKVQRLSNDVTRGLNAFDNPRGWKIPSHAERASFET